jgi:hypothetical protein
MLVREVVLRQLATVQDCQAQIRGWLTEHRDRWLTPRRAAVLETASLSCVWLPTWFVGVFALDCRQGLSNGAGVPTN